MIHFSKATLALTTVSALALASVANAQAPTATAAKNTTLEELIVTAQKREQRVEEVPLSVNVVSGEQLERQQVNNIFDLSRIAPSLEVTNAAGQSVGGGGQLRGIGTVTFGVGAVGAVGIVVDGVSQGDVNISDLFDIERIEVLKGPQGTLFGLTTSAGVINITTRAPSKTTLQGRARTELSDAGTLGSGYGQQVFQASLNIPIQDVAGLRIAANINRRQGANRNALDGSLDEHNSWGLRARMNMSPVERLTVNLNADYAKSKGDGPDFFTVYKADPAFTAQLANCRLGPGAPATPVVPSTSNRDYCTTQRIVNGDTTYGVSITLDYELEPFTVTWITAARRTRLVPLNALDIFRLQNAYFNPPPVIRPSDILLTGSPNPRPNNLVTQELRLSSPAGARFEYVAGLFYSNRNASSVGGSTTLVRDFFALGATPLTLTSNVGTPSSNQTFSKAAFGQGTFHVTDQFGIIVGARLTKEVLKQRNQNAAGIIARTRSSLDNTSWRLGAQYEVDPTLHTYAFVAHGYKGAQLAAPPNGSPPGTPSTIIKPEKPIDYEIGLKKVLFDGRAIADLNGFYQRVRNYQGQVCITNPTTQILSCSINNFSGVKSRGVEANLFGRVTDNFTVNTGLIWNKATYPKTSVSATGVVGPYRGPDGSDLSGAQLVNAPKWKFTFSGEYSRDFTEAYQGFVSAEMTYRSKIRYAPSKDPFLSNGDTTVFGGRLGVRNTENHWSAAIFARNLGNEHIPVLRQTGFPFGANYGQFLSTQSFRVVGLTLDTEF